MDTRLLVEMIGYLGSTLVVFSMLMTSVVKLRVVNTIGSVIFMCYALVIGSYPTALMNLCLIAINVVQLNRLFRDQKQYDMIEAGPGDRYVSYFLQKNLDDIREWFPSFSPEGKMGDTVFLVCCGSQPASVFIGNRVRPDTLEILLDYAAPVYRDTSAGRYLYGQLMQKGFRTLVFRETAPKHVPYLKKTGFRKNSEGAYELRLDRDMNMGGRYGE